LRILERVSAGEAGADHREAVYASTSAIDHGHYRHRRAPNRFANLVG
jgi:hypothetical protein